jgi:signal transduction histidine kinase
MNQAAPRTGYRAFLKMAKTNEENTASENSNVLYLRVFSFMVNHFVCMLRGGKEWGKQVSIFLFLLIPAFLQNLQAQQKTELLGIYDMRVGLPSNMINDITQDRFGYIWVATSMGLSRFDGKNFIKFPHNDSSEFFQDKIINSFYKKDGFIYLISTTSGIIQLNPENSCMKRIYNKGVSSVDFYDNNLLILSSDNMLLLIDENYKQIKRKFEEKEMGKALLHKTGIYISFYGKRPQRLNRKSLATEFIYPKKTMGWGGGFFRQKKGEVIFHTGKKLHKLTRDSLVEYEKITGKNINITYFNNVNEKAISYIINYNTPYFMQGDTVAPFRFMEMKNTEFRLIYQPDRNSALIGTNQGIVHVRSMQKIITQIDDSKSFRHPDTRVRRKIIETQKGSLLLTGYPNTLVTDKFLKNLYIYDAVQMGSRFFFGSDGNGLWESDSSLNNWTQIVNSDLAKDDRIYCILPLNSDTLLVGGKNKLTLFNIHSKKTQACKLTKNTILYKIALHPEKKYFVAGSSRGLIFIYIKNGLPFIYPRIIEGIKDAKDLLFIPEKNEMWTATDNGLYILDMNTYSVKKRYTEPEEISNPRVTALLLDNKNRIWASTYSGITVYGENIFMLGENNGLKNIEFNYNCALKRKNGDLIFGGLTSYDVINPELFGKFSFKDSFEISRFEKITQKQEIEFHFSVKTEEEAYSFSPDQEDLKLYFSNFDYTFGDLYRFFYKIDHGSWKEIKEDRYLVLANLPIGRQKVTIKMLNPFGAKAAEKTITLRARVVFYKHPYFLIFILSLLLAFALISYYFLRKTLKIEAETKERVAMDLHDETGTILTRLLFLSSRKTITQKEQENIKSGLQEALLSLRSFMESLYRKEVTSPDLKDEIGEFLQKSFSGSRIKPDVTFKLGTLQKVNPELFRDVKLCIYELITNFLKHSQGSHFSLEIEANKRQLIVRAADNGVMTNMNQLNTHGNGIRNIQKRVLRHSGIVIFDVNIPSGLKAEIRFNL